MNVATKALYRVTTADCVSQCEEVKATSFEDALYQATGYSTSQCVLLSQDNRAAHYCYCCHCEVFNIDVELIAEIV